MASSGWPKGRRLTSSRQAVLYTEQPAYRKLYDIMEGMGHVDSPQRTVLGTGGVDTHPLSMANVTEATRREFPPP